MSPCLRLIITAMVSGLPKPGWSLYTCTNGSSFGSRSEKMVRNCTRGRPQAKKTVMARNSIQAGRRCASTQRARRKRKEYMRRASDRAERHQGLLGEIAVVHLRVIGAGKMCVLDLPYLLQAGDPAGLDVGGVDVSPAPVRVFAVHHPLAAGFVQRISAVEGAVRLTLAIVGDHADH